MLSSAAPLFYLAFAYLALAVFVVMPAGVLFLAVTAVFERTVARPWIAAFAVAYVLSASAATCAAVMMTAVYGMFGGISAMAASAFLTLTTLLFLKTLDALMKGTYSVALYDSLVEPVIGPLNELRYIMSMSTLSREQFHENRRRRRDLAREPEPVMTPAPVPTQASETVPAARQAPRTPVRPPVVTPPAPTQTAPTSRSKGRHKASA